MGRAKENTQGIVAQEDLHARVRAAQKGDSNAFESLLLEHRALLFRMAMVRMRNTAEALDMLDEAIAKGWMKIRTLRDPALFSAWMARILINACNDRLRRMKRTLPLDEQGEIAAALESGDAMLDLRAAVQTLPEPLYSMIVLKYFDDLTIEQVAKQMGVPLGTAKSHLHRALKRLRIIMGEDAE